MDIIQSEFETVLNLSENNTGDGRTNDILNELPFRNEVVDIATTWKEIVILGKAYDESDTKLTDSQDSNGRGILEARQLQLSEEIDENRHIGIADKTFGGRVIEDADAKRAPSTRLLNGADIGDIPIEYRVEGLKDFELPVIGFYVDKRILPGFKYKVRLNGSNKFLFGEEAKFLKSIGMGYGKRITFSRYPINDFNHSHFWSDSNERGYSFSIQAVSCGDEFVICDESLRPLGRASVEAILLPQKEISSSTEDGTITKYVKVVLSVFADYNFERHGMLPLVGGESVVVKGIAVVIKKRRERRAVTVRVDKLFLPKVGICSLNKEI